MTLPVRYTRRENVFVWARRRALGEDGRPRCLICLTPMVQRIRGCPNCSRPAQSFNYEPKSRNIGAIRMARGERPDD